MRSLEHITLYTLKKYKDLVFKTFNIPTKGNLIIFKKI